MLTELGAKILQIDFKNHIKYIKPVYVCIFMLIQWLSPEVHEALSNLYLGVQAPISTQTSSLLISLKIFANEFHGSKKCHMNNFHEYICTEGVRRIYLTVEGGTKDC